MFCGVWGVWGLRLRGWVKWLRLRVESLGCLSFFWCFGVFRGFGVFGATVKRCLRVTVKGLRGWVKGLRVRG